MTAPASFDVRDIYAMNWQDYCAFMADEFRSTRTPAEILAHAAAMCWPGGHLWRHPLDRWAAQAGAEVRAQAREVLTAWLAEDDERQHGPAGCLLWGQYALWVVDQMATDPDCHWTLDELLAASDYRDEDWR